MKLKHLLISVVPLFIFVTLVLYLFYPALFPPPGHALFADDMWRSYGFFRRFFTESMQAGTVPWWNPYLFSGMPFMANPSISFYYPANWIFFFLQPAQAYGAIFALHICIAMTSMYWFGKRVLALRLIPALGASIAFGLSGYFLARTWAGHAETIAASALLPWVFGSFVLAMKKPTVLFVIQAGMSLAVQIFAGYQTVAMFTLEAIGIMSIFIFLYTKKISSIVAMILAVIIGLLLPAIQLVPMLEFFSLSVRNLQFPYTWVATGSLITESLKQLFQAFVMGDQYSFHGPPPNYPEQAMFVGVTTIILAITVFFSKSLKVLKFLKSHRNARGDQTFMVFGLTAVAIFSLWVSFGPNAPIDLHRLLWEVLPTYKHIRFPPRHLVLFTFSISALAGMGLGMIRQSWLQLLLVGIITLELYYPAKHVLELKPLPENLYDRQLISILTSDSQPHRLLQNFGTWIPLRDSFDFDAVMVNHVYSVTGYDPSILSKYYQFSDALIGNTQSSLLQHNVQIPYLDIYSPYIDFLNIKYVMVPVDYDPLGGVSTPRFKLLYTQADGGYRIYENIHVYPRFYMAGKVQILASTQAVLDSIRKRVVDPRIVVLLSQTDIHKPTAYNLNCTSTDSPKVQLSGYTLNEIILASESSCNSFLVTSEVMYPGWVAYIDGIKSEIVTNNLAFRALYVPSGKHVVIMRYDPTIFYIGGLISLITFISCLFILGITHRKKI